MGVYRLKENLDYSAGHLSTHFHTNILRVLSVILNHPVGERTSKLLQPVRTWWHIPVIQPSEGTAPALTQAPGQPGLDSEFQPSQGFLCDSQRTIKIKQHPSRQLDTDVTPLSSSLSWEAAAGTPMFEVSPG